MTARTLSKVLRMIRLRLDVGKAVQRFGRIQTRTSVPQPTKAWMPNLPSRVGQGFDSFAAERSYSRTQRHVTWQPAAGAGSSGGDGIEQSKSLVTAYGLPLNHVQHCTTFRPPDRFHV